MNKKRYLFIIFVLMMCSLIAFFFIKYTSSATKEKNNVKERENLLMLKLTVNNTILNIKLEDNSSSKALLEHLKDGDITINAEDYGGFEKVGNLGFSLPTNDEKITVEAGDLILYQGDKITLYYATNTWTFTKLGKVQNVTQDELKEILGNGDVTIKLSNFESS